MLRQASSVLGSQAVELENGTGLGRIGGLLVSQSGRKILAFVVRYPGFLTGPGQVISPIDVLDYSSGILLVRSREALLKPSEIANLEPLLKLRMKTIGQAVLTTAGKNLGVVADFIFESEDGEIIKYYIRPGLLQLFASQELILPASKVVRLTRRYLLVETGETELGLEEELPAARRTADLPPGS